MHPSQVSRFQRLSGPLLVAAVFALAWVFFSTRGLGSVADGAAIPIGGLLAATAALVQASLIPLAYLFGAFGLGRLVLALLNRSAGALERPFASHALQLAAGFGAMLFVSHAMGLAGLLTGNTTMSLLLAWVPTALGLLVLADQVVRGSLRPESWPVLPRAGALSSLPLALTLVAAASPPGWLWESEFGGYDAMSYHLQLPKEWATPAPEGVGRLWPVSHNVYSYLPSYFEAAFLHVGAMTPASTTLGSGSGLSAGERLVGGEGVWLLSCQLFHALTGLIAAMLVARCVYVVINRLGPVPISGPLNNGGTGVSPVQSPLDSPNESGTVPHSLAVVQRSRSSATSTSAAAAPLPSGVCANTSALLCACIAGAAVLATPWCVVVGSLAYNEMPMLALLAGAMLVVVERPQTQTNPLEPSRALLARAALIGALVGLACSVKPTALLLGAPAVGMWMFIHLPVRRWAWATLSGSIAGVGVMLPWLIRNTLASGNPVFPFASSLFGHGHWSAQQLATYARNHAPEFSFFDALGALMGHRGFGHPQWWGGWLPVLVLALLLAAIADRSLRRAALALPIGLALQVIAWAITTHQQSRFLLPLLVPMALGMGLGAHAILVRWAAWTTTGDSDRAGSARAGPARTGPARTRQPRIASAVLMLIPLALALASSVQFLSQRGGQPNARLTAGPGVVSGMGLIDTLAAADPDERREFAEYRASPEQFVNLSLHPGVLGPSTHAGARGSENGGAVYMLGDATPVYYADATGGVGAPVRYHTTWDRSPLGDAIRAAPNDPAAWSDALVDQGIEYVLINPRELARLVERDRYYDADVTVERLRAWLDLLAVRSAGQGDGASGSVTLVRSWRASNAGAPSSTPRSADPALWMLYRLSRAASSAQAREPAAPTQSN